MEERLLLNLIEHTRSTINYYSTINVQYLAPKCLKELLVWAIGELHAQMTVLSLGITHTRHDREVEMSYVTRIWHFFSHNWSHLRETVAGVQSNRAFSVEVWSMLTDLFSFSLSFGLPPSLFSA